MPSRFDPVLLDEEQTGMPFLGVVLNKFNIQREKYGSYGSYGSYGKK